MDKFTRMLVNGEITIKDKSAREAEILSEDLDYVLDMINEDEQLDELSKDLLSRYVKKAEKSGESLVRRGMKMGRASDKNYSQSDVERDKGNITKSRKLEYRANRQGREAHELGSKGHSRLQKAYEVGSRLKKENLDSEEDHQLDELSRDLLSRYTVKALKASDKANRKYSHHHANANKHDDRGLYDTTGKKASKHFAKADSHRQKARKHERDWEKREAGANLAAKKIAHKTYDKAGARALRDEYLEHVLDMINEDEQLVELSKKILGNYIKKATASRDDLKRTANRFRSADRMYGIGGSPHKKAMKNLFNKKARQRQDNIVKAANKLADKT